MDAAGTLALAVGGRTRGVLVGFSGGRDSTALLHAAAAMLGAGCTALHVNHGLNAAADEWQRHCERAAAAFGVAFEGVRVAVEARGSEQAARTARHAAFARRVGPGELLLLAHHAGDQTETVLQRLLSGRGFLPMPARRAIGGGELVRPWLELTADEVAAYARAHGLAAAPGWIDDPANRDPRHDRSFLRHAVLPALRSRWPGLDAGLARAVRAGADRDLLIRELVDPAEPFDYARWLERGLDDRTVATALRYWLERRGHGGVGERALAEFVRQCRRGEGQPSLGLDGRNLCGWRGRAEIVEPRPALPEVVPGRVPETLTLPHGTLTFATAATGLGEGPFEVRFRTGGERLATSAGHVEVKELLRAHAVPPWLRRGYPLIYCDGTLVAVPGVAVGAGPATQRGSWWPDWIFR